MFRTTVISLLLLLAGVSVYGQKLLRGPYLQTATTSSIIIRWRTDKPDDSRVYFGKNINALDNTIRNSTKVTDHLVTLKNLASNTKYFYSIGSDSILLQKTPDNYFFTLPQAGMKGDYRFGFFGDCGNNSMNETNVRDQFLKYIGTRDLNGFILLGDNAYETGSDEQYQSGFFNIFKDKFLPKYPVLPTPGNHDYANDANLRETINVPYYDVFTLPESGEIGGIPSNSPSYYSFDVGNIHFISLDSYGLDSGMAVSDTTSRQVVWLKKDLDQNKNKDWIIAFWHHPPYTQGSHNSDAEPDLVAIRQNLIPIFERYNVDLIINGHSHVYERSAMMHGYYGMEADFDSLKYTVKQAKTCNGSEYPYTYVKNDSTKGTVYVVAGSAGKLGGTHPGFPMPSMKYSNAAIGGAIYLEVQGNKLMEKWICSDGVIRDHFTIFKNVNKGTTYNIDEGDTITINASFPGNYLWSFDTANKQPRVRISPPSGNYVYYVTDPTDCLTDTFRVNVTPEVDSDLHSFQARFVTKHSIHVNWTQLEQQKIVNFHVQRSTDNVTYEPVYTCQSRPNSTDTDSYSFLDTNNISQYKYYYRIQSVNRSFTSKFSYVSAAYLDSLNSGYINSDLILAPNPSISNEIQIKLTYGDNVPATIITLDIHGNTVSKSDLILNDSFQKFLPQLRPGIYFVCVYIANTMLRKKIVITE